MKSKLLYLFLSLLFFACSKSIEYSEQFKTDTSGRYMYNDDNLMEVYYEGNTLFLNWKGGKVKPVAISNNEFFVPDMYKKLKFVKNPNNGERYLSVLPESGQGPITYDYLKVPDNFKTPSMNLKDGNYEEALQGYLAIKKKDSTSAFINEWDINDLGYKHLRNEEYDDAIAVFKLNLALHPNSYNVHDSLAEAYLKSGDSSNAYTNYKKAFEINKANIRAERFIKAYESKN